MRSIAWWYFQWPWRTPNPVFKVTAFLKSNIWETARRKDKVNIVQEETIPNIWNGTTFGDLDWPPNASLGFVSISWASCYYHNSGRAQLFVRVRARGLGVSKKIDPVRVEIEQKRGRSPGRVVDVYGKIELAAVIDDWSTIYSWSEVCLMK